MRIELQCYQHGMHVLAIFDTRRSCNAAGSWLIQRFRRGELLELLLERLEPLPGLAELAFGGQALVVGEIARGFGDQRVDVGGAAGVAAARRRRARRGRRRRAGAAAGVSVDGALPNSAGQRRLERRPVREPILQREHDEPQLRHRAALGLQVDRLGVQQRAADRDHDQAAAPHVRALLVPQRQLARQLRVLIDARLDLQRAVDQPASSGSRRRRAVP